MVVGDHETELSLRRIGRGEPRGSFRVARQRLRSAEDGRSCTERRNVEKLKVKARRGCTMGHLTQGDDVPAG